MNNHIVWSPGVTLEEIEEQVIRKAYAHFRDKTVTANALGIGRRTIDYKFEKYAENELKQAELIADKKRRDDEFHMRARGIRPDVLPVNVPQTLEAPAEVANAPAAATPQVPLVEEQVTSLKAKKR